MSAADLRRGELRVAIVRQALQDAQGEPLTLSQLARAIAEQEQGSTGHVTLKRAARKAAERLRAQGRAERVAGSADVPHPYFKKKHKLKCEAYRLVAPED